MLPETTKRKRRFITCCAFILCLSCGTGGVFFSLIKSPQARAQSYHVLSLSLAAEGKDAEALAAMAQAVSLNPAAPALWHDYAGLLERGGRFHAARQALNIARRIEGGDDVGPLYAMPAELRLSMLAEGPDLP